MRKNERVINIRKRLEHGLERGVAYMDSSAAFSSTTDTHRKKKGEEIKEGRKEARVHPTARAAGQADPRRSSWRAGDDSWLSSSCVLTSSLNPR